MGYAVRVAGWEVYRWMRHGFSTRQGGVSTVYGGPSLNLGWTKEDERAAVAENRRRLLEEIVGTPQERRFAPEPAVVTLRQMHSAKVRIIEAEDLAFEGWLQTVDGKAVLEGDGMMTDVPGVLLAIQVADCVPVMVADVEKRAVAVFHAGWRGTVGRIVERGIATMRQRYGSRAEGLVAAVGPSIGPCCYAVGEELRAEFGAAFGYEAELFSEEMRAPAWERDQPAGPGQAGARLYLDLWEANRRQLLEAGVLAERIAVVGECSACTRAGAERKYFSHRAEAGVAGRMMGVIGVAVG